MHNNDNPVTVENPRQSGRTLVGIDAAITARHHIAIRGGDGEKLTRFSVEPTLAGLRTLTEHDELRRPASETHREAVVEIVLAVEVTLDERELLGDAQRLPRGEDRHLGDGVGVVGERGDEGVAGFVDRDGVLLLGQEHVRSLAPAQQDAVPRRGR